MQELKNHLKAKPHLKKVYFNEKEEWAFVKHPKFQNEKSREEILAETEDETTKTIKSKTTKK